MLSGPIAATKVPPGPLKVSVPPTENAGPPSKPEGQAPLDVLRICPEYVPRPMKLASNVPWTATAETGSTPQL